MNKDQTLLKIARECLNLSTLETQHSDREDFRDQSVWNIKEALEQAYQAGYVQAYVEIIQRQAGTRK